MVEAGLRWIAVVSLLLAVAVAVAALALPSHRIAEGNAPEAAVPTAATAILLAWPLFAAALGGLGWIVDGVAEHEATQRPERRSGPRVKREAAVAFFALVLTTTDLVRSAYADALAPRQGVSNLVGGVLVATIGVTAVRFHWHRQPRNPSNGGRPRS